MQFYFTAVCLPDDPEGNAKLMLSILDCLPRANRVFYWIILFILSLKLIFCFICFISGYISVPIGSFIFSSISI